MRHGTRKFYYALLSVGGVSSFLITAWGCLASLMLDYRKPAELSLALCFNLPFPCFLLSIRSMTMVCCIAMGAARRVMRSCEPSRSVRILN